MLQMIDFPTILSSVGVNSKIAIGSFDIAVTVIYIAGIVAIGCWAGLRHRGQQNEAKEYFLAGGSLRWPIIGLSLFATNISCVHLVSLAQSGFDTGLLNGNFEWMAAFTLVLLGLFFAPLYIRSRVVTLPDFLERRYSRACRDWLAVLSITSAVTIHIGFSFLTGGIVLEELFGLNMTISIVVIAILTGLYTIVGGLLAVVLTEAIQTIVLVLGAALITWFAWEKMGGWEPMVQALKETNALGEDNTSKLSMLRPHGDPSGMPWYAIFLGYPVLGIWYWCADQTIVQRVLGARSEDHARVGPLFAGMIKILPVFIFVLPGLFAMTLVQTGKLDISHLERSSMRDIRVAAILAEDTSRQDKLVIGDQWTESQAALAKLSTPEFLRPLAEAETYNKKTRILNVDDALEQGLIDKSAAEVIRAGGKRVYNTKGIYAVMITQLMPPGLVGVLIAALLAALMSTVAGALNSISTLFSFDIYKRFRPEVPDHQLVLVGRISATAALLVALALVPLLNNYESIFNGMSTIIAHLAPPVTTVFMLGVFWKAASARSAEITLLLGSAIGASVFLLNTLFPNNPLGQVPFMMMAFYLLVTCVVIQIVTAILYPDHDAGGTQELCWSSPLEPLRHKGWSGLGDYRFLACLLVVTMGILYYLFR